MPTLFRLILLCPRLKVLRVLSIQDVQTFTLGQTEGLKSLELICSTRVGGGRSHSTDNPVADKGVEPERQYREGGRFTWEIELKPSELAFDTFQVVLAFDTLAQSRALGEEVFDVRVWYPDQRPFSNTIQMHVHLGSIDRQLINAIPSPIGTTGKITFPEHRSVDTRALETGMFTLEQRFPSFEVSASFEHHQLKALREVLAIFLSVVMGAALSALFEIKLARTKRINIATKDRQHVLLLPSLEELRDNQDSSRH